MKKKWLYWLVLISLFGLLAPFSALFFHDPSHQAKAADDGVRIMPLGDSITLGSGSSDWGGYREPLWNLFQQHGNNVNFVGSQQSGPSTFDTDNEGHSGWHISMLTDQMYEWLTATQPQIILLHIGTNDMWVNDDVANAPARLTTLLNRIAQISPSSLIMVAQIVPSSTPDIEQRIEDYNAAIPGVIQNQLAQGHHAQYINMHNIPLEHFNDNIHPNSAGYADMAQVWYEALSPLLANPTIFSAISPSSGPPGTQVTLSGQGFGTSQGSSIVRFGTTQASIVSWSDTSIVANVPTNLSPGTSLDVTITTNDQTSLPQNFQVLNVPEGWQGQDIGNVGLTGSNTYSNGTFTVAGSGLDIWGTADQFHYTYQTFNGNGSIVAHVASFQQLNDSTKVGVMIRSSVLSSAGEAFMALTPGGTTLYDRLTYGDSTNFHVGSGGVDFSWLKLVRIGNTITAYDSNDGITWNAIITFAIALPDSALFGLAVTAHDNTQLNTATFDNVDVRAYDVQPTPDTPQPPPHTPQPTSSATWTFCANEGGTCTVSGTHQVRYGANGVYNYQTATGSIACNNATFDDPTPGVVKQCDVSSSNGTPTPVS